MSLGAHVLLLGSVRCGHVLNFGHVKGYIGGKTFGGSLGLLD